LLVPFESLQHCLLTAVIPTNMKKCFSASEGFSLFLKDTLQQEVGLLTQEAPGRSAAPQMNPHIACRLLIAVSLVVSDVHMLITCTTADKLLRPIRSPSPLAPVRERCLGPVYQPDPVAPSQTSRGTKGLPQDYLPPHDTYIFCGSEVFEERAVSLNAA
ncbi:Glycerophosphodiester phosphodiesterase GDE1, partial [Dissostichus eleginoides]